MGLQMQITAPDLAAKLNGPNPPVLVDVREPEEFALCQIGGAILLPLSELQSRWSELQTFEGREIVVYCHHGLRSSHAIRFLELAGMDRLWNLSGGIDEWSVKVDPGVARY